MRGFYPFASGSKGNCHFLQTEESKILIDVGIGIRRLEKELLEIGVDPFEIDAILITHEHVDHIRGLPSVCKKYEIPVFANPDTAKGIFSVCSFMPEFKLFSTGEAFHFKDLKIHPFSIQHDTFDPVAFTITLDDFKIGVCTDLGFVTTLVKSHLMECDLLLIEANHDPEMVYASARPMVYKKRVLGRQGHLSNVDCATLVKEVAHDRLKQIYLAHLSEECNNPNLAYEVVSEALSSCGHDIPIKIAHQHKRSDPFPFAPEVVGKL